MDEAAMTLDDFRARWTGHTPKLQDINREYAVLVPLAQRPEGLCLLYEVRADTLGRQPGEVCFPGGRMEAGEDPAACALRETWEELAIPPERIQVVAQLDFLTHQGGFAMYPVLGILSPEGVEQLRPSPAEVKETFWVPVDWLRAHPPAVYTYKLIPDVKDDFPYDRIGFSQGYRWRGGHVDVPIYDWPGHPIWGLTGRITRRLMEQMP